MSQASEWAEALLKAREQYGVLDEHPPAPFSIQEKMLGPGRLVASVERDGQVHLSWSGDMAPEDFLALCRWCLAVFGE